MAASFSAAHPERLAHWRRVASLYGAGMIVSLVVALASALCLWRTRSREADPSELRQLHGG